MAMSSSTTSSSPAVRLHTISTPLSPLSTGPSTGKSSTFSFADSALSSTPSSPPLPTEKRKYDLDLQGAKASPKRRRAMGRPKNAWTPTRLRKLVRLYLMTNLEVIDIAKVLRTKDFHPSKRDIQKQLESLLQPRPNQIRLGAHITKARLRMLRDCRRLRRARRIEKPSYPERNQQQGTNIGSSRVLENTLLLSAFHKPEGDWSWLDIDKDPGHQACSRSPADHAVQSTASRSLRRFEIEDFLVEHLWDYQSDTIEQVHQAGTSVDSTTFGTAERAILAKAAVVSLKPNDAKLTARFKPPVPRIDWDRYRPRGAPPNSAFSVGSTLQMKPLPTLPTNLTFGGLDLEVQEVTMYCYDTEQSDLELTPPATQSTFALDSNPLIECPALEDKSDPESRLPVGGRPSRASVSSITSLKRRLSSKYSSSSVEDILSLMERHTISGSTASYCSSGRASEISSKKSSMAFLKQSEIQRSLPAADQQPVLPVKMKPPVVLPGAFPKYCWDQICRNLLRRCRHDRLLCEHTDLITGKFFDSHFDKNKNALLYGSIRAGNLSEADQFGNSILHLAASLSASVKYLINLIKQGANINATNAAGETFLHLLYAPNEEDDVCFLLEILSVRRFNFSQHDQHGQTSLHLLTRPWLRREYLSKVIRKIHSLGFVLPTSRDNLGFTLSRQMKYLGIHFLGFDPDAVMAIRRSLGLNCDTQGCIVGPYVPETTAGLTPHGNQSIPTHQQGIFQTIEAMENSLSYEHHADLLRTILAAGEKPWFEDSKGRNGLHCLAEVALHLPLPSSPGILSQSSTDGELSRTEKLRECYLDGLLSAGVNPNNYDNEGNTPLTAFLIHTRHAEDDNTTTRILAKLINAKADIYRRNRQGDTALHLAIKLGRRAATKFLLRKGANIHARNKKRLGVLEVGEEACKRAEHDTALYAQIRACIALAVTAGAVSEPTILMEWAPVTSYI